MLNYSTHIYASLLAVTASANVLIMPDMQCVCVWLRVRIAQVNEHNCASFSCFRPHSSIDLHSVNQTKVRVKRERTSTHAAIVETQTATARIVQIAIVFLSFVYSVCFIAWKSNHDAAKGMIRLLLENTLAVFCFHNLWLRYKEMLLCKLQVNARECIWKIPNNLSVFQITCTQSYLTISIDANNQQRKNEK